jgi:hypothetical protein
MASAIWQNILLTVKWPLDGNLKIHNAAQAACHRSTGTSGLFAVENQSRSFIRMHLLRWLVWEEPEKAHFTAAAWLN